MPADVLPVHFLTIVLNGEPFIRYSIDIFRELPFDWHWHIVEGVADLRHDTAWSIASGGHVAASCHRNGKSNDGTTEYLDELRSKYPDRVTVYRKPDGVCWDGKMEMVNAPLRHIRQECLLWQLDSDELWTAEQVVTARRMFLDQPEKTAAYFWCWYFVGERLIVSTRYCYSQNPRVEWLRTWRFRPGMRWSSHEPPRLVERVPGQQGEPVDVEVGTLNPFTHAETEKANLVFQHFAYATPEQLLFKEQYYGYHNAFVQWHELQKQTEFPRLLSRHFPWVKDHTAVDTAGNLGVVPLAQKVGNTWRFGSAVGLSSHSPPVCSNKQEVSTYRSPHQSRFVVDGVFFQLNQTGIARVWRSLLEEWVKSGFARQVTVLDRGGRVPSIPGICRRPFPLYDYDSTGRDAYLVQHACDEEGADAFISSYYTTPLETPSVFLAYDMIPEVLGADRSQPCWREKHYGILHAAAYLAISEQTARDLTRFYPQIPRDQINVCHCGVSDSFRPAGSVEVERFRRRHGIAWPYFLTVGNRVGLNGTKNVALLFQALAHLPAPERMGLVCAGGEPELEEELRSIGDIRCLCLGQRDDEELRAAYSGALALVYPSKYEGFGLPLLEAMCCGCPVITCRNSSLPEVADEAALYVTGTDVQELAQALRSIQLPEVRDRLISAGLERARHFSCAAQAEAVARRLIAVAGRGRGANLSVWSELRKLQAESQGAGPTHHIAQLTRQVSRLQLAQQELQAIKSGRLWKLRSAWQWSKRTAKRAIGA